MLECAKNITIVEGKDKNKVYKELNIVEGKEKQEEKMDNIFSKEEINIEEIRKRINELMGIYLFGPHHLTFMEIHKMKEDLR